jgi:hypothetical protein
VELLESSSDFLRRAGSGNAELLAQMGLDNHADANGFAVEPGLVT